MIKLEKDNVLGALVVHVKIDVTTLEGYSLSALQNIALEGIYISIGSRMDLGICYGYVLDVIMYHRSTLSWLDRDFKHLQVLIERCNFKIQSIKYRL